MKLKLTFNSLLLVALLLALTRTSPASTTWYVDGVHGNNGNNCKSSLAACKTIGHAISLASSGDSIRVAAATYTENLTIRISLNVIGSGASTTIVDGGGINSVVTIPNTSASVIPSRMTIRHGDAEVGAGVYNSGTLTITNTTISGNRASCAIHRHGAGGGGIANSGTLTITSSTINDNATVANAIPPCYRFICNPISLGGGVDNSGTLTITNSTLSSNSALRGGEYVLGGGIYNHAHSNAALSSTTLSGNSAGGGGGILNCCNGSIVIRNTIVASNSSGNCGGTMVSNGYNLSSDNTCNFHNSGDRNNTDPKLGPLQNNGGPTQTIPLLAGSPAIDAGNPSGCKDGSGHLLTTDQRGMPRPDKEDTTGCDMGDL